MPPRNRLSSEFALTQEMVANKVGKSRAAVTIIREEEKII